LIGSKNSLFSILDQILSIGMNFLLSVLFARYLGVKSLGQYSLGLAIVGILAIFSNFGITTIMSREIAKSLQKTKLYLGNAKFEEESYLFITKDVVIAIILDIFKVPFKEIKEKCEIQ
jgi:hypothetical protein